MGGGYIQLVVKGDEDLYLIGNPQITFFKSVYRQYTNFSMELVENDIQNTISTSDFRAHFKIGNNGDLLYKTHLEVDLPDIKIFNTDSKFKDNVEGKDINLGLDGFPDLSRIILKDVTSIDDIFYKKLPTIGKTNILYSYGESNKSKLNSDGQYFIKENISGNHNYNSPYQLNGIMYDHNYKWPEDTGSLYSGGKSRISYTNIQNTGQTDYTHHKFLSRILTDTIANGGVRFDPEDDTNNFLLSKDVDVDLKNYHKAEDNIFLEYDELFYDLFPNNHNISVYHLSGGGNTLSMDPLNESYSRKFINSIFNDHFIGANQQYYIDYVFRYGNGGVVGEINPTVPAFSEDVWRIQEDNIFDSTPPKLLYNNQRFTHHTRIDPPIGNINDLLKLKESMDLTSFLSIKRKFISYIYDRYLYILTVLSTPNDKLDVNHQRAQNIYKKMDIKTIIGIVYHGILRIIPVGQNNNNHTIIADSRTQICRALRHVKENLNVIFESVLNHALTVTKSYHNKKILSNNNYYTYTNNVGHALLKNIDISIGNQLIDRQSGEWLNVYNGLHDPYDTEHKMIGKWNNLPKNQHPLKQKLFIPLKFWFCKDIGNTLPIVSLQYHDIDIHIDVRGLKKLIIGSNYEGYHNNYEFMNNTNCKLFGLSNDEKRILPNDFEFSNNYSIKLWSNVIYLDINERKRFSETSHEYLIEQIQTIKEDYRENIRIPFKHSVKTLYWVIQNKTVIQETEVLDKVNYYLNGPSDGILKNNSQIANTNLQDYRIIRKIDKENNGVEPPVWEDKNDYFNYNTEYDENPFYYNNQVSFEHFNDCSLVFNGVERLSKLSPIYYRVLQPYDYNLNITSYDKIYTYSFSLKPDQYQPSGSCNFSKIDNPELRFNSNNLYDNYQITIFAINYNILRIMNGMGGLLYS